MPEPMREKDDLDVLLNSALASYADAGADSGLEKRVLAALEDTRSSPQHNPFFATRKRWLPWAIALPVAACLLLWIAIVNFKQTPSMKTQLAHESHETPAATRVGPPAKHPTGQKESAGKTVVLKGHDLSRAINRAVSTRALAPEGCPSHSIAGTTCAPLPKLDVFPTPQPLTMQEQALVVVATQTPTPELRALIEAENQKGEPFPIAAAHIPPLEPPDPGANDRQ